MATVLDTLLVRVEADDKRYQQDLRRLEGQTQASSRRLTSSFSAVRAGVAGLTVAVGALAASGLSRFFVGAAQSAQQSRVELQLFRRQLELTNQDVAGGERELRRLADSLGVIPEALAGNVTQLLRQGLAIEDIGQLLTGAAASALAAGRTVEQGVEGVTNAIVTQSSIYLNQVGIAENLDVAYRDYAKTLGVTVDALTKEQKAQAAVLLVQEATREEVASLDALQSGLTGTTNELNKQWAEFRRELGEFVLPAVNAVVGGLANLLGGLNALFDRLQRTRAGTQGSLAELRDTLYEVGDAAGVSDGAIQSFANTPIDLSQQSEEFRKLAQEIGLVNETAEEFALKRLDQLEAEALNTQRILRESVRFYQEELTDLLTGSQNFTPTEVTYLQDLLFAERTALRQEVAALQDIQELRDAILSGRAFTRPPRTQPPPPRTTTGAAAGGREPDVRPGAGALYSIFEAATRRRFDQAGVQEFAEQVEFATNVLKGLSTDVVPDVAVSVADAINVIPEAIAQVVSRTPAVIAALGLGPGPVPAPLPGALPRIGPNEGPGLGDARRAEAAQRSVIRAQLDYQESLDASAELERRRSEGLLNVIAADQLEYQNSRLASERQQEALRAKREASRALHEETRIRNAALEYQQSRLESERKQQQEADNALQLVIDAQLEYQASLKEAASRTQGGLVPQIDLNDVFGFNTPTEYFGPLIEESNFLTGVFGTLAGFAEQTAGALLGLTAGAENAQEQFERAVANTTFGTIGAIGAMLPFPLNLIVGLLAGLGGAFGSISADPRFQGEEKRDDFNPSGLFGTERPSTPPQIALQVGRAFSAPAVSSEVTGFVQAFGTHVDRFGGYVDTLGSAIERAGFAQASAL